MPQNENTFVPRKGQQELIESLPNIATGDILSVQWPTGYGKSIGFALAWKHCKEQGIANRMLFVVANDTQRQQVINDFSGDCKLVNASCAGGINAFDRSAGSLREARAGNVEVFVCTVHALEASNRGGLNTIRDLLETPGTKWMLGFDEYHHYGEDMAWGNAAKSYIELSSFTLAMSATPYRRGADTIFPKPDLVVTYQDGVEQSAVKPMICHTYHYEVTCISTNGEAKNYQTNELINEGDVHDLDKWEERKSIRYSSQYIHPLILNPLARLNGKRAETGKPLQMIIRAMSCAHAETLCYQVKELSGHLTVDWIGTGFNGRAKEVNRKILAAFCPPKDEDGNRGESTIDVLVQVSMAGEGFDSVNVAEIVDLYPSSLKAKDGRATQDKQFYGRGSRFIKGTNTVLHINVPTDHPLHKWGGSNLHEWMDAEGAVVAPRESNQREGEYEFNLLDFPEPPEFKREIELLEISEDNEHYKSFARQAATRRGYDLKKDADELMSLFCGTAQVAQEKQSRQLQTAELKQYIDDAVGSLALIKAKRKTTTKGVYGKLIGKFKKEINTEIMREMGKGRGDMILEELKQVASLLKRKIDSHGN